MKERVIVCAMCAVLIYILHSFIEWDMDIIKCQPGERFAMVFFWVLVSIIACGLSSILKENK